MSLGIYCYDYSRANELPPVEAGYERLAILVDETSKSLTYRLQTKMFENCENDFVEKKELILSQLKRQL